MPDPEISFVIPVYNEDENLPILYREITDVMRSVRRTYELVFVDDGSKDRTIRVIKDIVSRDPRAQFLSFRRNFGKSRALAEGFNFARGGVIFTMDGDLQDDPQEIPKFLAKIDEGYELVSGWKQRRQDPLGKTVPSRFFNWLTGRMTGIKLHDFNCGFKCYTRETAMSLDVYGELHRYLPAIAHWKGFRVTEIPIHHRPRVAGKSKFGVSRLLKGFLDLFTVKFLMAFREKPAHAFSSVGMLMFLAGFIAGSYLAYENLVYKAPIVRPLLFFVVLAIIVGIQLVSFGFISELIAYNSRKDLGACVRERSR